MASSRFITSLLGRTVHLLTDEDARAEAAAKGVPEEKISMITAGSWWSDLKRDPYARIIREKAKGTLVQIHLNKNNEPVYTIEFQKQLLAVDPDLWRLD